MSEVITHAPEAVLNRLIVDKRAFDVEGKQMDVTGAITMAEAHYIHDSIIEHEFSSCLETGVAYGASTIAICSALSQLESKGKPVKHYGIDPWQGPLFRYAAIAALKECGLDHIFELCDGPSHLMLPRLIESNVKVDFVFIDGMHTLDYTLVDLFFADKLLRPGGMICMHDMHLPSKKRAFRYLTQHRKYQRLPGLKKKPAHRVMGALKETLKSSPKSGWDQLTASEPMLVLRKVEDFEPAWDFYARI
jgi:predicted O-methyltransferase YrrM